MTRFFGATFLVVTTCLGGSDRFERTDDATERDVTEDPRFLGRDLDLDFERERVDEATERDVTEDPRLRIIFLGRDLDFERERADEATERELTEDPRFLGRERERVEDATERDVTEDPRLRIIFLGRDFDFERERVDEATERELTEDPRFLGRDLERDRDRDRGGVAADRDPTEEIEPLRPFVRSIEQERARPRVLDRDRDRVGGSSSSLQEQEDPSSNFPVSGSISSSGNVGASTNVPLVQINPSSKYFSMAYDS